MKILFLAPRLPWPLDTGGKIRTANILRQLAQRAQVHLLCFSFGPNEEQSAEELAQKMKIEITLVPGEDFNSLDQAINILCNPVPYSIVKYHTPEMMEMVRTVLRLGHFDAVHVDHLHMATYRSLFKNLPCVLDEHNVESQIMQRCAEVERNLLKKKIFALQARRMNNFESRTIKKFTACLAVSSDDTRTLQSWAGGKCDVHVVPNGFDGEYFHPAASFSHTALMKSGSSLLFTGSMDWLPNEDAVLYFAKNIFPKILGKVPQTQFYIVGKSPSPQIQQLAKAHPHINVTGRVEDVRPYLSRCDVFVVPLRIGGGTRLKILEAMAMSKALVSTTLGAEGIEASSGKELILADDPSQFAQEVVNLLNDTTRREQLGQAARQTACAKYEWAIVGKKMEEIYQKVIK